MNREDVTFIGLLALIGLGLSGWLLLFMLSSDPDGCYIVATLFR